MPSAACSRNPRLGSAPNPPHRQEQVIGRDIDRGLELRLQSFCGRRSAEGAVGREERVGLGLGLGIADGCKIVPVCPRPLLASIAVVFLLLGPSRPLLAVLPQPLPCLIPLCLRLVVLALSRVLHSARRLLIGFCVEGADGLLVAFASARNGRILTPSQGLLLPREFRQERVARDDAFASAVASVEKAFRKSRRLVNSEARLDDEPEHPEVDWLLRRLLQVLEHRLRNLFGQSLTQQSDECTAVGRVDAQCRRAS
mmetsp:Transcript_46129/g.128299  ORF Transcript_46129/g.128299 Transcript_46129/m.128299 type:complete len:255 (+) Transcript_46129:53-817(+)